MSIRYKGKSYSSLKEVNKEIKNMQEWLDVEVDADDLVLVDESYHNGRLILNYAIETSTEIGYLIIAQKTSGERQVLCMYICNV